MTIDFDEIIDRRGTYSMKWDAPGMLRESGIAEKLDDDSISLFLADMDFACPPAVVEAMHQTADTRVYGYTSCEAGTGYYDAVCGWFKKHYGWQIEKEQLTYVNSTVSAIAYALQAFSKPGDGVIIQPPVYGPFWGRVKAAGRRVVQNRLLEADGYYTMDFDDLEAKAADPDTTLLILCSPHNPVGRVWTADELGRLCAICAKHNVLVLADEIHQDILRAGTTFTPLVQVAGGCKAVYFTAVNKTFNMAGLHCTNVVLPDPALKQRYDDTIDALTGGMLPSPFTVAGAIAAYTQSEDWLRQLNAYIDGNIDWVLDFMKQRLPKVRCRRPEGTYILWLDFRGTGLSPAEVHRRIYDEANVILEAGRFFDPGAGDGFERVCLPVARPVLQQAFERIARAFEDLN